MNLVRLCGPTACAAARRVTNAALICALALLGTVSDAGAQQHTVRSGRARLSHDLAERLRSGDTRGASVIVTGSQERIDGIAARHGLQVRKRLASGAVLDVP